MSGVSESYDPDFIERNGPWLLTVLGLCLSCVGATLAYFLKSRCTRIACCGASCERNVLDLTESQVEIPHIPTLSMRPISNAPAAART